MNGAATRPLRSISKIKEASSEELFSDSLLAAQPVNRGRNRGKSLVHGPSVQVAYASIDAILVCAIGAIVLWLRFGMATLWRDERALSDGSFGHAYVGVFLLYSALVVMGCASQDLYHTPRGQSIVDESLMVAKAVGLATTLLVLFIFTSGYKDISRLVVVSAGVLNLVALSGWRYFKRRFVLRRRAEGIGVSRVLIVGAGRIGKALADLLQQNPHLGYSFYGFVDEKPPSDTRTVGAVSDLRHLALTKFVDELFITLPSEREVVKAIVLEAHQLRLGLKIVPDLYDGLGWRASLHTLGGFPVMDLHWQPIPAVGLVMKRVLDISVSAFMLLVTGPLLVALAILIRLDSPGPSLYVADRLGVKGKKFSCYKLRTMVADAEGRKETLRQNNECQGPRFKMQKDPRVTRLGWWLRKYSLDELPQLWNVLRGDMSLVGPRPPSVDDYERYEVEHLRRLDVSPGLTGLWQVTARTDPSFGTYMALDLEYIENWSLGLDLQILLKTVPAVFRGEGR